MCRNDILICREYVIKGRDQILQALSVLYNKKNSMAVKKVAKKAVKKVAKKAVKKAVKKVAKKTAKRA